MFPHVGEPRGRLWIAVNLDDVVTSVFLFFVLRDRQRRSPVVAGVLAGGFLAIDVLFFSANA